tara:strand:- start:2498 stop:2656 length:159 start_codon:yes stop_codon:yes gene_type:complete
MAVGAYRLEVVFFVVAVLVTRDDVVHLGRLSWSACLPAWLAQVVVTAQDTEA